MKCHVLFTRRVGFTFAFALFMLQIHTNHLFACSCAKPGTPTQELEKAIAVFSGTVISIDKVKLDGWGRQHKVKFEVEKSWKGVDEKTAWVLTASDGARCGYRFVSGESYLVYAHGRKEDLRASLCSRTKKLADAEQDLSELGPGTVRPTPISPKGKLGTTWGRIKRGR